MHLRPSYGRTAGWEMLRADGWQGRRSNRPFAAPLQPLSEKYGARHGAGRDRHPPELRQLAVQLADRDAAPGRAGPASPRPAIAGGARPGPQDPRLDHPPSATGVRAPAA